MSVTLKQILEFEEGLRLEPYLCPAGHWTIGIGWNLEAHGLPAFACKEFFGSGKISRETAFLLLDRSIQPAKNDARRWYQADVTIGYPPGMTDARQRACENMAFQLGYTRLMGFTKTRQYIIEGDWYQASRECLDSVWYRGSDTEPPQSPKRAERVSRVFETGSDDFYEALI